MTSSSPLYKLIGIILSWEKGKRKGTERAKKDRESGNLRKMEKMHTSEDPRQENLLATSSHS